MGYRNSFIMSVGVLQVDSRSSYAPFIMAVRLNETVAEIKKRVQHKFGVSSREFRNWRFTWHSRFPILTELSDQDCLQFRIEDSLMIGGATGDFVGLQRPVSGSRNALELCEVRYLLICTCLSIFTYLSITLHSTNTQCYLGSTDIRTIVYVTGW